MRGIFTAAKFGRTWYSLNPDAVAEQLGHERRRVVRALVVLEEKGQVQLRASDVRNRYTLLDPTADADALATGLAERFLHRERQEQERLAQVLALVTHAGCQTAFLVAHFGEVRPAPCGHCTFCITGRGQTLPDLPPRPPLPAHIDPAALTALRQTHPVALNDPRSAARFLCGLTSPALTRARLSRHPLFGFLASYPFAEVMAWAQSTDPIVLIK